MRLEAENKMTVTKELFFEGMLRSSRDSYGKFAAKAMLVFAGIWVALLAFTLISGGNLGYAFFSLFVVVLISFWLLWWTPRSHAKKSWKKMQDAWGEAPQRITRFYADHLEIRGDCADKDVRYDDIKEIKFSQNLMLLVCYDKMGIMLSRTGFTLGDEETVRSLVGGIKDRG